MAVVLEKKDQDEFDSRKNDPTKCPHFSINRVLDMWTCNSCGAEFIPKNPRHNTVFKKSIKFQT